MSSNISFKLSESDNQFLARFETTMNRIKIFYIIVGLSFFASLIQLLAGILCHQPGRYMIAFIWLMLGSLVIMISYMFKRLFSIITQLKMRILELDYK